jgi:hypothetical protein
MSTHLWYLHFCNRKWGSWCTLRELKVYHELWNRAAYCFPFCGALRLASYISFDAYEFCSIQADLNGEDHGSVDACRNSATLGLSLSSKSFWVAAYPSTNCCSTPSSLDSWICTRSTSVALGPPYSLELQPLFHLCKNFTTYDPNL